MFEVPIHIAVAGGGLIVGLAFGALAWRTQFCIVGSLYSAVVADDDRGLRSVYLAMAVAILFTQVLVSAGLIDVDKSIYRGSTLHWAGAVIGGFLFGGGMVKANGCGSGSLVNLGGGDLRSLIVLLILGLFAYMTLNGLTAIPRVALENWADLDLTGVGFIAQGLDQIVGTLFGVDPETLRWPLALAVGTAILTYVCQREAFRQSPRHVASGIGVGSIIALGWYVTGYLGDDLFEPAEIGSLTFALPIGETILYMVTFTGSKMNFGIGAVVGVVLGSTIVARWRGEYRLQYPEGDKDLIDGILGGAMMGVGGIFAYGCTIGNGLSGISVLSMGSVLAWIAIMAGGHWSAERKFAITD